MTATVKLAPIGFNGIYTLTNVQTGEHRTFSVRTQKDDAKFAPGSRIVALLTGPNNEEDYTGFGFVNDRGVHVWKSKRGDAGKPSAFDHYAAIVYRALTFLKGNGEVLTGEIGYMGRRYTVQLAKRCLACNKRLTNPTSIARGYGDDCAAKLGIL
jgi:hypothetical protein